MGKASHSPFSLKRLVSIPTEISREQETASSLWCVERNIVTFVCQQTTKRSIPMLFVRGDGVILVSPPLRVGLYISKDGSKQAVVRKSYIYCF